MQLVKLVPYQGYSESATALAQELHCLKVVSPYYRQRRELIVNWGCSSFGSKQIHTTLNHPTSVAKASNKLTTLDVLRRAGVACPEFTTSLPVASTWLMEDSRVLERHTLTGHSGAGIVIKRRGDTLSSAPLYTKYFKKLHEYRVHVFQGRVIDFTKKMRPSGYEELEGHNPYVRNHANGWVFAREGIALPVAAGQEAIKAVSALGLDFGAVDIGHNADDTVSVFEVNTAPGLEGTTLIAYATNIALVAVRHIHT